MTEIDPSANFNATGEILFEGKDLCAKYYQALKADMMIIVFISAGNCGLKGRDEFRSSLEKYGASLIFVNDYLKLWYNTEEFFELLNVVDPIVNKYRNVCALGESMGGCGAIVSTQFLTKISRVLAFSPQFSIKPPFIEFDEYYRNVGRERLGSRYVFSNYAIGARSEICQLVYSCNVWQDYLHKSMFEAYHFSTVNAHSPHHSVSGYLKQHGSLETLFDVFTNFELPWNAGSLERSIAAFLTPVRLTIEAQMCNSIVS